MLHRAELAERMALQNRCAELDRAAHERCELGGSATWFLWGCPSLCTLSPAAHSRSDMYVAQHTCTTCTRAHMYTCRRRYLMEVTKRACEMAANDVEMIEQRRQLRDGPSAYVPADAHAQEPLSAKEVSTG